MDTGIAHTQETSQTTHLDMFGGMPSKKKRKVAFFYCNTCRYVQDAVSDGRPGRQRKPMFCTRSEAHDADGGLWCTAIQTPQTSCNLFDCVEIHRQRFYFLVLRHMHDIGHARHTHECGTRGEATGILHLRCYLCCWRRLPISPIFASEYRRSTSSVSFITLAVPSCSVASSSADEERSVSLGFSTSAAVNCASICDGCLPRVRWQAVISFETHGGERHGLRHRSCAACLKRNCRNLAALRAHCSQLWVFLVGRQNPRVHDVAIRAGEVCVSASGWEHSRRELLRDSTT